MNRFLLGALAMGAVFVLTSFALTHTSPPATGPAWTVSQYQLDRAFRLQTVLDGNPLTMTMPATGGIVITQLRIVSGGGTSVTVTVNGASEAFNFASAVSYDLNPPIIARPGDVLTFQAYPGAPTIGISGYTTLPGET
jgi:hypothetical protein